jgi:hypothetical protein
MLSGFLSASFCCIIVVTPVLNQFVIFLSVDGIIKKGAFLAPFS